jgi:prepilin peptidase CpaA
MSQIHFVAFALVLLPPALALGWAAVSDYRSYSIPNRACLIVAGVYALAFPVLPLPTWLEGLAAGAIVLFAGAALFARNLLGGGDVKLSAAIALWAGPALFPDFALTTGLAGAALAVVMLSPLRRWMPASPHSARAGGLKQPMPFGVPLAVGGARVLALHLLPHL